MAITKCLRLIKDSRDDSEMFAALLVVARKLVKLSDQLTDPARKSIFDTIGFAFISRLLITSNPDVAASGSVPQDNPYIKLAVLVIILTKNLSVAHSEMINKITTFVEIVNSFPSVSVEMFGDVLQCKLMYRN